MGDKLESVKQLLRSVLLSSQKGVKATRLQGEYRELCGSYIPHDQFGFSSLHEFMVSINDVVRIGHDAENELTYYAIADSKTQHIQAMVAKQKSKKVKKQKAPSSFARNKTYFKPHLSAPNTYKSRKQSPFKPSFYSSGKKYNNFSLVVQNSAKTENKYSEKASAKKSEVKDFAAQKTDNQIYFINNAPPRFSNKQKRTERLTSSDISAYKNPLGSFTADNTAMHDKGSKENLRFQSSQENDKQKEEQAKLNLKKLLSGNPFGVHSSSIRSLYERTYREDLPSNLLSDIVNETSSDYASVEKINVGGDSRIVVYSHDRKFPENMNPNSAKKQHASIVINCHNQLIPGEDYNVEVINVVDCDKVYVHLVSEAEEKKEMVNLMKKLFAQSSTNFPIKAGDYVVTKDFYRAKIISVHNSQIELYQVDMTDSNTTYWTSVDQVRPMTPAIANYSIFLICCSMHRPTGGGKWLPQSTGRFSDSYSNMNLVMTPVTVSSKKSVESSSIIHEHSVLFYKQSHGRETKFNINAKLHEEEMIHLEALKNCCNPFEFQPNKYASLPDEEYCELYVFNASCCTEVEVCLIGEGYSDELVKLENAMFEYYSNIDKSFVLPKPVPVDCIYAVLSDETCVRGKVISLDHDQATVYLVDNCDVDVVPVSELRPLTKEFSILPMQAIKVSLAGLDHDALSTHSKILEKVNGTAVYRTCTSRIVGRFGSASSKTTYIVELFEAGGSDGDSINQMCFSLIVEKNLLPCIPPRGELFPVSISHVDEESDCVFVQLAGKGMFQLNECMAKLQITYVNQRIPPSKYATMLYPGKLCLVIIANSVFRARVTNFTDNSKPRGISVFLIDYGLHEEVSRGMVLSLEEEKALSIPPQAVCCRLSVAQKPETKFKFLSEVSDKIKTSLVLMCIDEESDNDDFCIVSMWIKEEERIQILPKSIQSSVNISGVSGSSSLVSPTTASTMKNVVSESEVADRLGISREVQSVHTNLQENKSSSVSALVGDTDKLYIKDTKYDNDGQQSMKAEQLKANSVITENVSQLIDAHNKMQQDHSQCIVEENPLLVKVEEVISPDCLQIIALKNIPARNILTTAISKHYKTYSALSTTLNVEVGQIYAHYSSGEYCWYRVKVLAHLADTVDIYLVDYGECRRVEMCSLHPLDKKFQNILPLIILARLTGIETLEKDMNVWNNEISLRLSQLIKKNTYFAHLLKVSSSTLPYANDIWEICLCDTTSQSDVWINDVLVDKWRCAKYVE